MRGDRSRPALRLPQQIAVDEVEDLGVDSRVELPCHELRRAPKRLDAEDRRWRIARSIDVPSVVSMYGAELYSGVSIETTGAAGCLAAALVMRRASRESSPAKACGASTRLAESASSTTRPQLWRQPYSETNASARRVDEDRAAGAARYPPTSSVPTCG